MKVGVCGMGRMGASIAERLIAVGHEVGVWNRDTTKTKPLVDAGAKAFASPAALAEGCDVTIVMLLNDAVAYAQAQPRPFSGRLGREERIENALAD